MLRDFALAALTALGLTAGPARAALLVEYNLQGRTAAETTFSPPTYEAPGLSGSTLTPGSGLNSPYGFANSYAFNGWTTGTDLDGDDYIGFTVTPDAGKSITYDAITFRLMSDANDPRGPQSWRLQGSTNGFVRSTLLAEFNSTSGGFTAGPLSLAALGTIDTAVEFRLFGFAAGSSESFGGLAFDFEFPDPPGIVLNGTVQSAAAVPEPGSLALLGVAAAGLAAGRARRRVAG